MKYKDFEGTIDELVNLKLNEIEQKENVKILHAVESGSRSWGFASPDSDYDVRFIYVRPVEHYLRLDKQKDFLNWELDETLDINGWDLSKALQNFHKSNATLFEWSNSPVVYRTTGTWQHIQKETESCFSCKAAMYHYYGTANSNYYAHLLDEMVKYKKYFYVLRPILACKWIAEKKCPPPVRFSELVETVLEPELRPVVEQLVAVKIKMAESEKQERIEVLNRYLEEKLKEYKELAAEMSEAECKDWGKLNRLFREIIGIEKEQVHKK